MLTTLAPTVSIDPTTPIPAQIGGLLQGTISLVISSGVLNQLNGPGAGYVLLGVLDQDIPNVPMHPNTSEIMGNGGSDTIFRLREGIERFMITDINNPAATSKAQSTLFISLDLIGAGAGVPVFNHVPGGSNVLFLDGHVEFLRYTPGPIDPNGYATDQGALQPVSPSFAYLVGGIVDALNQANL